MHLQIFDVEHGACALLTCDNGARLMIDCGHNSTTGWYPGDYLASLGIGAHKAAAAALESLTRSLESAHGSSRKTRRLGAAIPPKLHGCER
jgi:hypothetical protein